MILEAMNNQYLIAEHYYDLTEYIDKNIYKFRRNGKYLQEGFGTVALWIAGIALAAGIGWWVYKKYFDKSNNKDKKEEASQQKLVEENKETENGANTLNQEIPNGNFQSMEQFVSAPTFDKFMEECQTSLANVNDVDKKETLIKIYAKNYASQYSNITEGEIQELLGINEVHNDQLEAGARFNLNGKFTPRWAIGACLSLMAFPLTSISKGITWILDKAKKLIKGEYGKNKNYKNSIKLALYYLDFFMAVQIILEKNSN